MSEDAQALSMQERDAGIVRASIVGIVANILLAAFKAAVGALSNSIAITLDAVNNLSDAFSSVVTIVGTKLASRPADASHPFGHGRAEYLTTIAIGIVVAFAGVEAARESIWRIINPEEATYEAVTLIVVGVAVIAKIVLGRYALSRGKALNSGSLRASGTDALMDAIISASTLVAAVIFILFGVSLEAWLGLVISGFIVKAGVDILREAIAKILGGRIDASLAQEVRAAVMTVPGVHGAYDLVLNDYGPNRYFGSVHVEVDDTLTATEIDALTRKVQDAVMEKCDVMVHTVGIYSTNTQRTGEQADIFLALMRLANNDRNILQTHGFYVNEETKRVQFDMVVGFDAPDRPAVVDGVCQELHRQFPAYEFVATLDSDISD